MISQTPAAASEMTVSIRPAGPHSLRSDEYKTMEPEKGKLVQPTGCLEWLPKGCFRGSAEPQAPGGAGRGEDESGLPGLVWVESFLRQGGGVVAGWVV